MPSRTANGNAQAFWRSAQLGQVLNISGLLVVVLPITARMDIILRTKEENFTETVQKAHQQAPFTCAINRLMYGLSSSGYASLGLGPVDPKHTVPEGLRIKQSTVIGGRSARDMFFVANDYYGGYTFGAGDPPLNCSRAMGGLGPIIIDGLPYGTSTLCKQPVQCPPNGAPPSNKTQFMTQRSNRTYASQQSKAPSTGKAILSTNKQEGRLLVAVQRHGAQGQYFDALRTWLLDLGCDNAVFADGSDSVMLYSRGLFQARPGAMKDRTNTIGLSFTI